MSLLLIESLAFNNAIPAPGKIPSSREAFVACKASSMRSFFSFISISVPPPTLMIATPPIILAKRSCKRSISYGELEPSIWAFNSEIRSLILAVSPLPSTIVVVSLPTVTVLALPNQSILKRSNFIPLVGEIKVPPVTAAISSKINVLRSPKSGALTATTFKIPLILFTIRVDNASPSISSATTSNDLFSDDTRSRIGNKSFTALILPSNNNTKASVNTACIELLSVTM